MFEIVRTHEIAVGHRVSGHENKCQHLHGHNLVFSFVVAPEDGHSLDSVGRVIDFSVVKSHLCNWLETMWDHRMLLWREDPLFDALRALDPHVTALPCNPTAENLARHLVDDIAPMQLLGTGVRLIACTVQETSKCGARYTRRAA